MELVAERVDEAIDRGVLATAVQVQSEAIVSISSRPTRGREYKRGKKKHIASLPGNPPNTDKGGLVADLSMGLRHVKGSKVAYVFSTLDYGAYLELIMDRAFLRPALEAKKGRLKPNIENQAKKILSGN